MKLHPTTIVLEGAGRAVGGGVIGFTIGSVFGTMLAARGIVPPVGAAAGVPLAILFATVGIGYEVAHYRRFEYELTQDSLDIESGVFFKRDREIPFRRVQNVDISRDLFARLLSVAVVSIETAGGGETEARLRYVAVQEARRLQQEIRKRKNGLREAETGVESTADREELFALDDRDLVILSVLSFDPRMLSVLFFVLPALGPNLLPDVDAARGMVVFALVMLGAIASAIAIWGLSAALTFVQYYGFRLTRVGDELQYERGLVQRYDGSVPMEKIQTLVVEENLLMRQFGFAALSVETAGYAPGSTPRGGSEAAVPLAPVDVVYDLARTIEPFERPTFERPPKRARMRYGTRYTIVVAVMAALAGAVSTWIVSFPWYVVFGLLVIVPLAADRKWRHRGWALGDGYAFTRSGFFRRTTHVVPDFRVQTVIERRSPFQRRWSLSSVVIDTASSSGLLGGDAVAIDLDEGTAGSLRESVRARLQTALGNRRPPANRD